MDPGSISEVTERLTRWCGRPGSGFARVEWDSAYSRDEVIHLLADGLTKCNIIFHELELPHGGVPQATVSRLLEDLHTFGESVVSITGIEWTVPEDGGALDTLAALSFQRENLASLPIRQIWWMPSNFTEKFILGVPDLESWFQLRLHLADVHSLDRDAKGEVAAPGQRTISVQEARSLSARFWNRLNTARSQGLSDDQIFTDLAAPALNALGSAGLGLEAKAIVNALPEVQSALIKHLEELRQDGGNKNARMLMAGVNLAQLLADKGDLAEARSLNERILQDCIQKWGNEHLETLAARDSLASLLYRQGDFTGAANSETQVLESRRKFLGDEHPDTLKAINNLAQYLQASGALSGARGLQEQHLAGSIKTLGVDHPETLTAMNNLASILCEQGDLLGAQLMGERALDGQRRVLGSDHPDTLTSMNNLAQTLQAQGSFARAQELGEKVLEAFERVLGPEHPDTLAALNNMAGSYYVQGDFAQARRLQEKALEALGRVQGAGHPKTLAAINSLDRILRAQQAAQGSRLREQVSELR